jgi:hypothetical protein
MPAYREKLEKGFPLFSQEELDNIKNRYEEGLTWEDIERELLRKNIILKKATFRKYIHDNNLPKAIGYKKIDKRRLAIFPNNILSHINLLQYYYRVENSKIVDILFGIYIKDIYQDEMTYLEAIEVLLGGSSHNIYASIYKYLGWDDGEVYFAIEETLANRKEDLKKALSMLERIDAKFESVIRKEVDKLVSFLEDNRISLTEIPNAKKES